MEFIEDVNGNEYWYARELMTVLQYAKWQNFKKIITKAMITCENSDISINDCFPDVILHKRILLFRLENKKSMKKNIACSQKMRKDFIKEI